MKEMKNSNKILAENSAERERPLGGYSIDY
jgi:hypothetical protein